MGTTKTSKPRQRATSKIATTASHDVSQGPLAVEQKKLRVVAASLFALVESHWMAVQEVRADVSRHLATIVEQELSYLPNALDFEANAQSVRERWDELAASSRQAGTSPAVDLVGQALLVAGAGNSQVADAISTIRTDSDTLLEELRFAAEELHLAAKVKVPQERQAKKLKPSFCRTKRRRELVNLLTGFSQRKTEKNEQPRNFDLRLTSKRLRRWLRENKEDSRTEAVHNVWVDLVGVDTWQGPEWYGLARWWVGARRGISCLQRLRTRVEVRHEEETHFLGQMVTQGEPYQRGHRRIEQLARALQLADELAGLLKELEPKLEEEQGRELIARVLSGSDVLAPKRSRPPDARYLAATQKRLQEAGLKPDEIARLFAPEQATDKEVKKESERIRKRLARSVTQPAGKKSPPL